jgi:hypothetical protein
MVDAFVEETEDSIASSKDERSRRAVAAGSSTAGLVQGHDMANGKYRTI